MDLQIASNWENWPTMILVLCISPYAGAWAATDNSSVPTPSASIARRCSGVILADPPSRHPSLPAISAAALGLTAHPHNLDRREREDKGEIISKCKWKLSKNTICLPILATSCPLLTTAMWDLCYKQVILAGTLKEAPYLEHLNSQNFIWLSRSIEQCLFVSF